MFPGGFAVRTIHYPFVALAVGIIAALVLGCASDSPAGGGGASPTDQNAMVIDHNSADITAIPEQWLSAAKSQLHIAYGHTSHGSQLTRGMASLVGFANEGGLGLSLPRTMSGQGNIQPLLTHSCSPVSLS